MSGTEPHSPVIMFFTLFASLFSKLIALKNLIKSSENYKKILFYLLFYLFLNLPNKHIIRNIIQMPTIFQPWTSGTDVISGAFAFYLKINQIH